MSVYSGFATRQQQHKYNNLIETLVIALKKRIIKFYAGEPCDQPKFKLLVKKVYKKMFLLEKGKFMAPKYTSCFTDLIESMNIQINYDTMSDASSMMSQTFSLRKEGNDNEVDQLKSHNILTNKKNLMESKVQFNTMNMTMKMNHSALSLEKNLNFLKPENQQDVDHKRQTLVPHRSASIEPFGEGLRQLKKPNKLRKLADLKDVRGTIHMPKVEDFLPKKQEVQPGIYIRKNAFFDPNNPQQQKPVFRRQKYSRAQVQVEDI